jgi:hypothetical protein
VPVKVFDSIFFVSLVRHAVSPPEALLFTTPCLPLKAGTAGFVDTPLLLWGQLGVQLIAQLAKLR